VNKTQWVQLTGEALRAAAPPGLRFVLVCASLDTAGRLAWLAESNHGSVLPFLRSYIGAIEAQLKFNEATEADTNL
jgi:hypothetical protein